MGIFKKKSFWLSCLFFASSVARYIMCLDVVTVGKLWAHAAFAVLTVVFLRKFKVIETVFSDFHAAPALLFFTAGTVSAVALAEGFIGYERVHDAAGGIFSRLGLSYSPLFGTAALAGLSVFSTAVTIYWLYNIILRGKLKADICSILKKKLFWLAPGAMAVLLIAVSCFTNMFTVPLAPDGKPENDIVFTSDSATLLEYDAYNLATHSENDIRQPLFNVFSSVFAAPAKLLSKALFFWDGAYGVILGCVELVLLWLAIALLIKLAGFTASAKKMLAVCFAVSFPVLLFSLMAEQYIFALFWLAVFLYASLTGCTGSSALYAAATGSMLTSGVLVPLICREGGAKNVIKTLWNAFLMFCATAVLSGNVNAFITAPSTVMKLLRFSGTGYPFLQRLYMFTGFLSNCLFAPELSVVELKDGLVAVSMPVAQKISAAGAAVLLLAVAGFVLNRKKRLAKICLGWCCLSVLLLLAVGWGAAENGMILYTLYFSWSYILLIAMGIRRALSRTKYAGTVVLGVMAALMLSINLPALKELIVIGCTYFPR